MSPTLGALGIFLSFGLIVVLVLRRVNYGLALTLGAVILGLFFGLTPIDFFEGAYFTVTDSATIELALVVTLIPILAKSMEDTKLMEGFIEGLKNKLSPRAVLATVPAVLGLLPMMGGALLSAPIIDDEASNLGLSAEKKSVINLWFRHIWFYASPLSPTLIIMESLTGIRLYQIILVNLTTFLSHIVIGYFFIIKPIGNVCVKASSTNLWHTLVKGSTPITLTIVSNIVGVPLTVSLVLGIASALILGRFDLKRSVKTVKDGFQWKLIVATLGVMYFRYVIRFAGTDSFIISYATNLGVPVVAFITAIPLLFGLITAHPTASIVMSVPLALSALKVLSPATLSILYISTVVSYNISPLHLCLVLTVSYFKPKIREVYLWLLPLFTLDYVVGLLTGFTLMGF
ncbi:MAG: DUF401 family protein [Candidatus Bathyarchaeia archaeon]